MIARIAERNVKRVRLVQREDETCRYDLVTNNGKRYTLYVSGHHTIVVEDHKLDIALTLVIPTDESNVRQYRRLAFELARLFTSSKRSNRQEFDRLCRVFNLQPQLSISQHSYRWTDVYIEVRPDVGGTPWESL